MTYIKENNLLKVETTEVKSVSYSIDALLESRTTLEKELEEVNKLISEAEKLGIVSDTIK